MRKGGEKREKNCERSERRRERKEEGEKEREEARTTLLCSVKIPWTLYNFSCSALLSPPFSASCRHSK